jgi:hypothetical protein
MHLKRVSESELFERHWWQPNSQKLVFDQEPERNLRMPIGLPKMSLITKTEKAKDEMQVESYIEPDAPKEEDE